MIEQEIQSYVFSSGEYPDSLADIKLDNLKDPWGTPYQYLNFEGVKGKGKMRKDHSLVPVNTNYDLYSMGADRKSSAPFTAAASADDIVRANDGAYIGLVSHY